VSKPFTEEKKSAALSSSLYNTFTQKHQAHFIESKSELKHWQESKQSISGDQLYAPADKSEEKNSIQKGEDTFIPESYLIRNDNKKYTGENFIQLHHTYIITQNENGIIAIHQQNAHERILYERFSNALKGKPIATQRSLFPATIELALADCVLLNDLLSDLQLLGYMVEPFGNNCFVIQGTPADVIQGNEKVAIENMLEQYKHFSNEVKFNKREKLLRSMAWQQSIRSGTSLALKEMRSIADDLFDCETCNCTPNGKPTYLEFKKNELEKMFGRG
jgi:DNA mismatch repair protein MutL